jgi:arylsulfatase A-like enzyme
MAVDIAPTLAMAAGARIPDTWEGQALSFDPPATERALFFPMQTHFSSHGKRAVALREGKLKYLYFPSKDRPGDPTGTQALFDLSVDPGERHNLADGSEDEWLGRVEDLWKRYGPMAVSSAAGLDRTVLEQLQGLGYVEVKKDEP